MQTRKFKSRFNDLWIMPLILSSLLAGCGSGKTIRVTDVYGDPVAGVEITVGSLTMTDIPTHTDRNGVAKVIDSNITHPTWITIRKRGVGSTSLMYTDRWPKLVTLRGYD